MYFCCLFSPPVPTRELEEKENREFHFGNTTTAKISLPFHSQTRVFYRNYFAPQKGGKLPINSQVQKSQGQHFATLQVQGAFDRVIQIFINRGNFSVQQWKSHSWLKTEAQQFVPADSDGSDHLSRDSHFITGLFCADSMRNSLSITLSSLERVFNLSAPQFLGHKIGKD